ncbi:XRE family transcriptional regulator [Kaistia terrae]|uniref:XRE family transcriptional regulator n=1 Tax=Kaistia terrae TaxID=537017 RepID=A0ABW0PU70_9HYPH|nr:XRE family transcriptional regulator [Kaistia terrae]MCX5578302.1 XRE family transcriptional regulator [Kaistia terrae]
MTEPAFLTGRMIAAARALTSISLADLAIDAGIDIERLRLLERSGSTPVTPRSDAEAIANALDRFGALLVHEGDGLGAGVRLKFTRLDVKQIARMEGEGGPALSDDVP